MEKCLQSSQYFYENYTQFKDANGNVIKPKVRESDYVFFEHFDAINRRIRELEEEEMTDAVVVETKINPS